MNLRRLILVLLTVGVFLDLAISAVLIYNNREIQNATKQAHIIKVAAYEACIANNDAKRADAERWTEVLALLKDDHTTPALVQFIAGVEKANREADALRDCGALSP